MRWLLVLAALGGPALPLSAQSPPIVAVGSRVRLRIPAGNGKFLPRFDGTIVRISGDTLTLRPKTGGGSRLYTRSWENQLLMLTDRRPAIAKGATIGALVGVLTAGYVVTLGGRSCNGDEIACYTRKHVAVRNAAILGGAGLLIGAAVGAISPKKTWTRVWLPQGDAGASSGAGGFSLGLSIAF